MAKKATAPAALATIAPNTRVTGEDREKLKLAFKTKYEAGATIRSLHEETGRSFGAVQRLLDEAGVTMRPRGGARRTA